jgi:hypothetical protein
MPIPTDTCFDVHTEQLPSALKERWLATTHHDQVKAAEPFKGLMGSATEKK